MSGAQRLPSAGWALVGYGVRACAPPQRWAAMLAPAVAGVVLGWLAAQMGGRPIEERFADVAEQGLFSLVLPLACLVVGDAVLGADIRAGTFLLTWLSPVRFSVVVLGRWLAGWLVASAVLVPAFVAAALVAGVPGAVGWLVVAVVAGTAAYIALFVLLGTLLRRAVLWALTVVLLGEGILATNVDALAQVSPMWQAQQAFAGLWTDGGDELLRVGLPEGWSSVLHLAAVAAACLGVATWRMRHLRPVPGDD